MQSCGASILSYFNCWKTLEPVCINLRARIRALRARIRANYLDPHLNEMSVPSVNVLGMENLQETVGMSPLIESAIKLNEVYKSLLEGGFSEDEALSLIAKMTKNGR